MWHALQKLEGYPTRTAAQFNAKYKAELYVFFMEVWMTVIFAPPCEWRVCHDDDLP